MAVSEIAVVRQFSRNANRTTATTMAASTSTRCTLSIEASMKLACRNRIWSALMPCGKVARRAPAMASSISPRQRDGVDVGLLLDRDDDRRLAHVAGVAALDLGCELDRGDLMQIDRPLVDGRDDDVAQVVEAGGAADIADEIFARMLVGEAAAGIDAELRQRLLELLVGDAERAQRRAVAARRGTGGPRRRSGSPGRRPECSAAGAGSTKSAISRNSIGVARVAGHARSAGSGP